MEDLFLLNPQHLRKMFTYMCSQCTAPDDPITNIAQKFLQGKLHISFGVSGIAFFEDGVIYPYFYLTREQRQYLYSIASSITREKDCPQRYKLCNGCIVLTDFTGKTLDQRTVWRMILESVAENQKHKDCLRMLANVLIQRIMCRTKHSKDVMTHVHTLASEIFGEESATHHSALPEHTPA